MGNRQALFLAFLCFVGCVVCASDDEPTSIFYPFGPGHGDQTLHTNDDESSGSIPIAINFTFFDRIHSHLYVNNNGGISFGGDIQSYTPEAFPLSENYTFIAIYWSDVDTRHDNHGTVYYRETQDPDLLMMLTADVTRTYGNRGLGFFKAEWAFIATWWEVTYFSGQSYLDYYYHNKGETNTYQMAIVTDGTYSFTFFNYGNLMWTTGLAADGQVAAQVGFNAGDGATYFVVPDSRTRDIINIQYTSNMGITGRWIFRIDQATITADTCIGSDSDLTPTLEGCPTLSEPVLEGGMYVYFYCDLLHSYTKKDAVIFEVDFLFDNVKDERVPTIVLKREETRARLHEKYLQGNLGKQVSCQAVGYYDNTPDIQSSPAQSNSYFAGIKASSYSVTVYEGDDTPTPVYLKSTLPIGCSTRLSDGSLSGCKVAFNIDSSDNLVVYQPGKDSEEAATCQYRLDHSDWKPSEGQAYSETHPLYIYPTLSLTTDPPLLEQVQFESVPYLDKRDEMGELYTYMWNDYQPPAVTVYRYESTENGATCYANGDPRMTTFDKVMYSIYAEGQFVMAKSLSARQFEVHVRHERCQGTLAVSCVCGVAVSEGNDTVVLDKCNGQILHQGHMTASTSGKLNDRMKLTCNRQGNAFTIQTPSGAFANIHTNTWGMNVDLHVPGKDVNQTQGLCGTYDDNRRNEFRLSGSEVFIDAGNSHQLDDFVQSWRISPGESLFERPPSPVYPDSSFVTQYCQCSDYNLDELVPCQTPVTDPLTLPEVTFLTVTIPTSEIAGSLFTSLGRKKRDTAFDNDNSINYEYDPSAFNFAEDSTNDIQFEWPTVNGITEDVARDYCFSGITQSVVYALCKEYVENIEDIVEKCVADVQVSSSLTIWAEDKLAEVENQCRTNALASNHTDSTDGDARRETVEWMREMLSDVCPGQCSGRGVCSNATCLCHAGYEGEDCSVHTSSPPSVLSLSNSGLCDLSVQPCTDVLVIANNLIFTETLSCKVETRITGAVVTTTARFEGHGQIRCGLPTHSESTQTYSVSVSRDGVHYGSSGLVTVYNGYCMECTHNGCVVQENKCSIKDICYHAGDVHPDDPCRVCDPERNATVWFKGQDESCDESGIDSHKSGINYALIFCLGVFIPLGLVALAVPAFWFFRTKARKDECLSKRERGQSYLYREEKPERAQTGSKYHENVKASPSHSVPRVCKPAKVSEVVVADSHIPQMRAGPKVVQTGLSAKSVITPVEITGGSVQGGGIRDQAFDCSEFLTAETPHNVPPPCNLIR